MFAILLRGMGRIASVARVSGVLVAVFRDPEVAPLQLGIVDSTAIEMTAAYFVATVSGTVASLKNYQ
jgi:ribose 5-phosphate isomerase RpiB